MSEKRQKTYVQGVSFREKTLPSGVSFFNMYISPKFLEFLEAHKNDKGGVSIDVWPRDVPDKFGNTHNVVLNDFVPNAQGQAQADKASMQGFDAGDDGLPF